MAEQPNQEPELVVLEDYQINPEIAWTGDEVTITLLDLATRGAQPLQLTGPLAQAFLWIHQGVAADAEASLIEQLRTAGAVLPA